MAIKIEGFARTFFVGASAVAGKRIVKFDTTDDTVIHAVAAADSSIGISDIGGATGERVDVFRSGIIPVEYGGNVTRGQLLTADSQGRAIAATATAGSNVRVIGVAEESGVSGDIGAVLIAPGSFQG